MPDPFQELLGATLDHLRDLKERGVRYVTVSPETLSALSQAAPLRLAPPSPSAGTGVTATPPAAPATLRPALSPETFQKLSRESITPQPPTAVSLDHAAKAQAIAEVRERALVCVKCAPLAASRKNVVFGVGDINAQLMFVGEAPGIDEDAQGEPFVGVAGQLLTKMIQAMGLSREAVYIANILKCRPDTPGQTTGNRKPTPEEMKTCLPYLHAQIDLIRPRVLVGLGATAMEGLLGEPIGITRLRGQWQTFRDIPLMPTFHPSFLLRPENASKKRLVWEDMLAVMEKLGLPISEKQRGYFRR
jgi:uracil-DNA glycosylase family 4